MAEEDDDYREFFEPDECDRDGLDMIYDEQTGYGIYAK